MPNVVHTVEALTPLSANDRLRAGVLQVPNGVGASAGAAVAIVVANLALPPNYSVMVSPNQDATHYITAKTATGFTINLLPRLAANTLAAGTLDVAILA